MIVQQKPSAVNSEIEATSLRARVTDAAYVREFDRRWRGLPPAYDRDWGWEGEHGRAVANWLIVSGKPRPRNINQMIVALINATNNGILA